jgi:hypothetical protein
LYHVAADAPPKWREREQTAQTNGWSGETDLAAYLRHVCRERQGLIAALLIENRTLRSKVTIEDRLAFELRRLHDRLESVEHALAGAHRPLLRMITEITA